MHNESVELFPSLTSLSSPKLRNRTNRTINTFLIVSQGPFRFFLVCMLTSFLETPYADAAQDLPDLIKKRAEADIEARIDSIQDLAIEQGLTDVLIPSTDAYVTAICFLGAKSLSHVLSHIERCKDRLLAIGPRSEAARRQIVTSVMEYWTEKPGTGVNIVDKLLNYTILTPMCVLEWALVYNLDTGKILTHAHVYEMVAGTLHKVTNRVRQLVRGRNEAPVKQRPLLDEALAREREEMRKLFEVVEDALQGVAEGSADSMVESADADSEGMALLRGWGRRWLRAFRRKGAVEESWVGEMLAQGDAVAVDGSGTGDGNGEVVGMAEEGDAMAEEIL